MAEAVIDIILGSLKEFLVYKGSLVGGERNEIEGLTSDLELLKGAIKDVPATDDRRHTRKALLNSVRKAVLNAEDAVDKFILEKTRDKRSIFSRVIHYCLHPTLSMYIKIRGIREGVSKLNTQLRADGWDLPKISRPTAYGFKEAPLVDKDNVVGFHEPADELMRSLLGGSEGLDVIPIVGMVGLGKTTLAQMVYRDERINYNFLHRAWACSSTGCRVEDVLTSIIRQLGHASEDAYKMSLSEIAYEVKRCLTNSKYFIVLDDLWSIETWDALRVAFPDNNNGSRILLTTRNKRIALSANLNQKYYGLKFLTTSESFELLEKKVFGNSKCPKHLTELALQIASACEGLPLAIVVISGSLLPKRQMKDWWEKVAARVNPFLSNDGSGFTDVIGQTYNTLSSNGQLCFLYFGLLPEGNVPVSKLVRLWIAEGFIQDELELGLEYKAITCLEDLVDRNLVIPISRRSNGEIRTCYVHNILRDFCIQEAEVQGLYHHIRNSHVSLSGNYRRINIPSYDLSSFLPKASGNPIRTILTFSDKKIDMEPHLMKSLKGLKTIRILEATSIKLLSFPKSLGELVRLRYLSFSCDFRRIPTSISNFWSLQTLIIVTSARVIEFPKEIWKLYQLRHLQSNVSALLPVPPDSYSKIILGNMQNLLIIAPESCTLKVFTRIPDLKKLGIQGKIDLSSTESQLIDNLGRLRQLNNLKLLSDLNSGSIVQKLPGKFSNVLGGLMKLTISGTSLGWESMTILGELKKLQVLKVTNNAFIGEQWKANQGIFPSLILLRIDTTDLRTWHIGKNQFLELSSLSLRYCDKLEAIPTLLANLPAFQNLEVYRCCTSTAQSAREIHRKGAISRLAIYPPDM